MVALNQYSTDSPAELDLVCKLSKEAGADGVCSFNTTLTFAGAFVCTHWARGGEGALTLAKAVYGICKEKKAVSNGFRFLYPLELSIKEKIIAIATQIYHAGGVEFLPKAEEKIALYTKAVRLHHLFSLKLRRGITTYQFAWPRLIYLSLTRLK